MFLQSCLSSGLGGFADLHAFDKSGRLHVLSRSGDSGRDKALPVACSYALHFSLTTRAGRIHVVVPGVLFAVGLSGFFFWFPILRQRVSCVPVCLLCGNWGMRWAGCSRVYCRISRVLATFFAALGCAWPAGWCRFHWSLVCSL